MITDSLVAEVRTLARAAAADILDIYQSMTPEALALQEKADRSPLTAADLAAHRRLVSGLRRLTPEVPILSEEAAEIPLAERARWARFWLLDPLDGTREFLSRNGEFTVNVALIERGRPVFGLVHVPVGGREYWGRPGVGAWRAANAQALAEPLHIARRSQVPVRVVGSRSHRGDSLDGFLARIGPHALVALGSSLKLCVLAEGEADVYPRLGPTSQWDIAAGQAVLEGAGGRVCTLEGATLTYEARGDFLNPFFVAFGPSDRDWLADLRGDAR